MSIFGDIIGSIGRGLDLLDLGSKANGIGKGLGVVSTIDSIRDFASNPSPAAAATFAGSVLGSLSGGSLGLGIGLGIAGVMGLTVGGGLALGLTTGGYLIAGLGSLLGGMWGGYTGATDPYFQDFLQNTIFVPLFDLKNDQQNNIDSLIDAMIEEWQNADDPLRDQPDLPDLPDIPLPDLPLPDGDGSGSGANQLILNEFNFPTVSPLVLDLDQDSQIELTPLSNQGSSFFDLDADGFAEQTGWVQADDGLLAMDRNALA